MGITACNSQACIAECLDDCLSQTVKNIQIIVSDDASDDDTVRICRQYAAQHGNIKIIQQERNVGAFANAKAVLDAADTEYFMQRDDDDITEPEYVRILLQLLKQNPQKHGAVSASKFYKKKGKVIEYYRAPEISADKSTSIISVMHSHLPSKNGLFRTAYLRDIFARLERMFPSMTGGDRLCDLMFALDNSLVSTNDVVYHWRRNIRPTCIRSPLAPQESYRTLNQRLEAMRKLKTMSADFIFAMNQIIDDSGLDKETIRMVKKRRKKFLKTSAMPYSFRLYKKMLMFLVLGRYCWFK